MHGWMLKQHTNVKENCSITYGKNKYYAKEERDQVKIIYITVYFKIYKPLATLTMDCLFTLLAFGKTDMNVSCTTAWICSSFPLWPSGCCNSLTYQHIMNSLHSWLYHELFHPLVSLQLFLHVDVHLIYFLNIVSSCRHRCIILCVSFQADAT